mgnify:CR=1 FL=1
MKNNWKKILNELSYRVSTGIPDLSNEQHLMKLWDILKEHNWNLDARVELLKNLDEQDKPSVQSILNRSFKNAQSGRMIKVSSAAITLVAGYMHIKRHKFNWKLIAINTLIGLIGVMLVTLFIQNYISDDLIKGFIPYLLIGMAVFLSLAQQVLRLKPHKLPHL